MVTRQAYSASIQTDTRAGGYCRRCGKEHWLGSGNTIALALQLMHQFQEHCTIDLFSAPSTGDEALQLDYLFGPARGKMFGLMECRADDGTVVVLRAFSGQYNGRWLVEGWAPPLFEVDDFITLTHTREKKIKELGALIDQSRRHSQPWQLLRKKRRRLSQELMQDIHALYSVRNFRGETVSLKEAFTGMSGIPTGTGDCCAPKLLNFAARNHLYPLGICEFYWGRENRSNSHRHGTFTSSCREKCAPVLGFMLCGLKNGGSAGDKAADGQNQ